jgi:hypothetical protein
MNLSLLRLLDQVLRRHTRALNLLVSYRAPSAGFTLDRVFLDANVLYSAAYLKLSGLIRLWNLDEVQLLRSAYAIEEARRNLAMDRPVHRA